MCDFDTLSDEAKVLHHKKLLLCAENFGGKNAFLHLLEAIRESKPHPLTAMNRSFTMAYGTVTWNKAIFPDTMQLLLKARVNESKQGNLLPEKTAKNYKKILNLVRTLKPIVFHIKPASQEDGIGFFLQAFDRLDEETTLLNPIFDALFFCSIASVKEVLHYDPEG